MQAHNSQHFTWLLGDSGYPLEPWLLTPIAEPYTDKENRFNAMHTKARNTIERAFGVLKTRFRCLNKHRVLHYGHEKVGKIVYTCAIFHNMLTHAFDIDSTILETEEQNVECNINNDYLEEGRRIRNTYINSM